MKSFSRAPVPQSSGTRSKPNLEKIEMGEKGKGKRGGKKKEKKRRRRRRKKERKKKKGKEGKGKRGVVGVERGLSISIVVRARQEIRRVGGPRERGACEKERERLGGRWRVREKDLQDLRGCLSFEGA
jgi:hypothetical protein